MEANPATPFLSLSRITSSCITGKNDSCEFRWKRNPLATHLRGDCYAQERTSSRIGVTRGKPSLENRTFFCPRGARPAKEPLTPELPPILKVLPFSHASADRRTGHTCPLSWRGIDPGSGRKMAEPPLAATHRYVCTSHNQFLNIRGGSGVGKTF
jgi:hypothetical protein